MSNLANAKHLWPHASRGWQLLLLAGLALGSAPAHAQAPPTSSAYRSRATDSLRAVLRLSRAELADTQRTLTFFSLGEEYFLNDSQEALRWARLGLAHARRIGFLRGEYMLLSGLSRFAGDAEDFAQAERWAQELQRRTDQAPPRPGAAPAAPLPGRGPANDGRFGQPPE